MDPQSTMDQTKPPYNVGFDAGYKEGYDSGYNTGHSQGYSTGYNQGYNQGYDEGYREGYRPGYKAGYADGYKASYEAAHDTGYNDGFKRGYDVGYEESWDAAFNEGYDSSYNIGYHRGFKAGYLDGASEIGTVAAEEAVTSLLPENHILPQYTVVEMILRGLRTCRSELIPLLSGAEVAARIERALEKEKPLSIVRLGDGESLVLAQEVVLDIRTIQNRAPWLVHAGVEVPDLPAQTALKESILRADIVGVPTSRMHNHQPLLFKSFDALEIEWEKLNLTHAIINYILLKEGLLQTAIGDHSVLLVGNHAETLRTVLEKAGVNIAGAVGPVKGVRDTARVMEEVRRYEFDLAFVAAGVAAVILSQRIATEMGKVALDFGHLADELIHGQARW